MSDMGIALSLHQSGRIPLAIEFACARGETLALVGPSGAGKTTVLRAIAGLYQPVSGRIVCDSAVWLDTEQEITLRPHERRVGLVFQSYALFPHLSVAGNVEIALGHLERGARHARTMELLDRVKLTGFADRRATMLSGGEQQRVALARALARDPQVLLLDEPFSAVDRRTRNQLQDDLLRLRADSPAPIILVTHDLQDVMELADMIVVIDRGVVLQAGAVRDVVESPVSEQVRELLELSGRRRESGKTATHPV